MNPEEAFIPALTHTERLERMQQAIDQFKTSIDRLTRGVPRGPGVSEAEVARRRRRNKAARKARRQGRK